MFFPRDIFRVARDIFGKNGRGVEKIGREIIEKINRDKINFYLQNINSIIYFFVSVTAFRESARDTPATIFRIIALDIEEVTVTIIKKVLT